MLLSLRNKKDERQDAMREIYIYLDNIDNIKTDELNQILNV